MAQEVEIKGLKIENGLLPVQQAGGKYDAAVATGRVYSQTTTVLGLAIPIYTASTPLGNVIWNPAGSSVAVKLLSYAAHYVSGTAAYGNLMLMAKTGMPAVIATAATITAFADTVAKNALLGGGLVSKVKSSNAGTVTITALGADDGLVSLGSINLEAATSTAHATVLSPVYDFDGRVVLLPGSICFVACRVSSTALYAQTIQWQEVDL